jgi:endoglucanase
LSILANISMHCFWALFSLLVTLSFSGGSFAYDSARVQITQPSGSDAVVVSLAERHARLARGVNVFLDMETKDGVLLHADEPRNQFTSEDVLRLKRMGITHVAISTYSRVFWNDGMFSENSWNALPAKELRDKIHIIIRMLNEADIAVALKIMPSEDEMRSLYFSRADQLPMWQAFYTYWTREFGSYSPDLLFFHTLNEPRFVLFMAKEQGIEADLDSRYPPKLVAGATQMWVEIEDTLIKAIRSQAPAHTIILSGDAFAGPEGLMVRRPTAADANVIYNFHYYLPLIFTHQSATWAPFPGSKLTYLRYPPDAANCTERMQSSPEAAANPHLARYCSGAWDRTRHSGEFASLAEWVKQTGSYVWLGEFGAFPDHVDPDSITSYYRDMRMLAERYGFGWCAWEYTNWLKRLNNKEMIDALGL